MYQLVLRDRSFASVVDEIVERACRTVPGLDREACRALVGLAFRARIRQTTACGQHPECNVREPLWGGHAAPASATCGWMDQDPQALPSMFATAAADLARPAPADRGEIERRLTAAFRSVFSELVYCNPRCGRAEVCRSEPLSPLRHR